MGSHPSVWQSQRSFLTSAISSAIFTRLWEAAKPIYEADRPAKKELKKQVRGIRPISPRLEGESDQESAVARDYCLAGRSAITDDGHPPLAASGLKLHDRLSQISASLARGAEKRGAFQNRGCACSRF